MIVARSVRYLYCRSLGRRPTLLSYSHLLRPNQDPTLQSRPVVIESSPPNRDSALSAPIPVATQSGGIARSIIFCQLCGGRTKHELPDGEDMLRAICTLCGKIANQNPKMVVGGLIEHDESPSLPLCRDEERGPPPLHCNYHMPLTRTLPAGYVEIGESATEGAIRETLEEAGAEVEVISPFCSIGHSSYRTDIYHFPGKDADASLFAGSGIVRLPAISLFDIPFNSLAFSSIFVMLKLVRSAPAGLSLYAFNALCCRQYIEDVKIGRPRFHYGIINKRPGSSPSDMRTFTLDNHFHS